MQYSKTIVIDLDGTLTIPDDERSYSEKHPNLEVVFRLRDYVTLGYKIVIFTSRNMRTFDGEIGAINIHTLPTILEWLRRHEVPFDEVIVGKPWCGHDGFYVDDRALRPDEFAKMTPDEVQSLLSRDGGQ